jgi:hypothetical protein
MHPAHDADLLAEVLGEVAGENSRRDGYGHAGSAEHDRRSRIEDRRSKAED